MPAIFHVSVVFVFVVVVAFVAQCCFFMIVGFNLLLSLLTSFCSF